MNGLPGKILVLGASGLVGGRLCRRLQQDGLGVRGASRQKAPAGSGLPGQVGVDWADPDSLEAACADIAGVVHLASPNAAQIADSPGLLAEWESGNAALCRAMQRHRIRRAVYLSSIHVYGDALQGSVHEATPLRPTHPYGIMHARAESLLRESGLPWVILRSTNGVGWPVRPETNCWMLLANDLCRQAASLRRIRLRGQGRDERDFLPLGDILAAIRFFLLGEPEREGTFLLASGRTSTTGWLARRVAQEFSRQTGDSLEGVAESAVEPPENPRFRLQTDQLRAAGFVPEEGLAGEIQELMSRCLAWFAPQPGGVAGASPGVEGRA